MGFLAERLAQIAIDLAERNSGVGNHDIEIVAPVIGEGLRRPGCHSRRLHRRQLVEHLACDDLSAEATVGHIGRDLEWFDDEAGVMGIHPDAVDGGTHERRDHDGGQNFESDLHERAGTLGVQQVVPRGMFGPEQFVLVLNEAGLLGQKGVRLLAARRSKHTPGRTIVPQWQLVGRRFAF